MCEPPKISIVSIVIVALAPAEELDMTPEDLPYAQYARQPGLQLLY